MKIVHVIDNLTLGGAETLLYATIKKLSFAEHHIIILNEKIQIAGVDEVATIHCLHHAGWHTLLSTCRKMRKLVFTLRPEIIHSHLFLSSFITRLALGRKYSIIYTIHNLYSATVFTKLHSRWMEKLIYNDRHVLVAVSQYVLEDYKKTITKCDNGYVLYNFIDDRFIDKSVKKSSFPQTLKKWVAIGSLKPQKNIEKMISLFADFYKNASDKDGISLDIYGEGSLRVKLEEKVRLLQVPVNLKGNRKDIADILGDYDAYISTSSYEGYGIAPMEALSRGLPLFLSDIPVYKEIYKGNAFYFNTDSRASSAFLGACKSYIQLTIEDKMALLNNGVHFANTTSNSKRYVSELMRIYEPIAKRNLYKFFCKE
jgi:glycosyltransferase involved in cell wall biosynthesis